MRLFQMNVFYRPPCKRQSIFSFDGAFKINKSIYNRKTHNQTKKTTKQTNKNTNKKQKQLKASHNSPRCSNHTIVFVCPCDHLYACICILKTPQLRNHGLRFVYLIIVRSCTILIYQFGDNTSAFTLN